MIIAALAACVLGASIAEDGQAFTRANEGCRLVAYVDTTGHRTIGYGHKMNDDDADTWTKAQASEAFRVEYRRAAEACWKVLKAHGVDTQGMPTWVACVCIDLTYNLGSGGFGTFERMIGCLRERDYFNAARELMGSRYATQVPRRATRLAMILRACATQHLESN